MLNFFKTSLTEKIFLLPFKQEINTDKKFMKSLTRKIFMRKIIINKCENCLTFWLRCK